jgi:hypothetical protein
VPEPGNPIALDRYANVYNNPLKYVDPSGHVIKTTCPFCDEEADISDWPEWLKKLVKGLGWISPISFEVDLEENVIRGPTHQEWIDDSITGINPMMVIEGVAGSLGKEVIEEVGERVIKEAMEEGGEAGLVKLLRDKLGRHADDLLRKKGIWGNISGTKGLDHSFSRHAHEWFGRKVPKRTHFVQWQELLEKAAMSNKVFNWHTSGESTVAHLARIDGNYIVVQFYTHGKRAGELATAFVPSAAQLEWIFHELGILR